MLDGSGDGIGRRGSITLGLATAAGVILSADARAEVGKGAMKITVLYGEPKDPAAFESYYAQKHMPMVYAVKELARVELAKLVPGADGKPPAYYRITELWFENPAVMKEVTARPEWRAIVEDVPKFASGGATVLISQVE